MNNANVVGLSPERPNIKYSVIPMPDVADLCSTLAQELIKVQADTPKTVLFCQTLQQCGDFHTRIKRLLGETTRTTCSQYISFSSDKSFYICIKDRVTG